MRNETALTLFDVRRTGPGLWSARGLERFDQPNGSQLGGYVMGLMMAALLRESDRHGTPAALTGTFMAPMDAGEAKITTLRLQTGRSLQVWRAELLQADRLHAQATVTFAQRPADGASFQWIAPPAAPPPEALERHTAPPAAPRWLNSFDRRPVSDPFQTPSDGISLIWTRDPEGGAMDYPRLAMFADMFPPRSFLALGPGGMSSTITNSIYFHAPEDVIEGVGDDFVLMHGRGRRGSGGICDLTAEIWRRDGVLLATTEQLWWFRESTP